MNYKDMSTEVLLKYVNDKLGDGYSVIKIANELGVNESSIRKRLSKEGYKRIGNEFILVGQSGRQSVLGIEKVRGQQNQTADVIQKGDDVVHLTNKENFIELMKNFETIMEIVNKYKSSNVLPAGGIVVQLPYEDSNDYKTSVRVNKTVMEDFRKFCEKHKEFTQKELLSAALLEYIDKYK